MYKYLHILNDIENMIQNGEIREGKKLPSIRSLVTQYECNKATVIRALHELESVTLYILSLKVDTTLLKIREYYRK